MNPGIHAMSNNDYHAVTDWWSSSQLKAALPERYKAGGSQDALDFGTLFHAVVLEPDTLDAYAVLDADAIAGDNPKTGRPYDAPHMTARYKAAVAEAEQGGKIVVTQADWNRAHAMADAVRAHPTASALLFDTEGTAEESAFWRDDNGIQHKARFDRRIPGAIIDLKSTSAKPGADALTRTVIDYGYELSAAHYRAVAAGLGLDVQAFAWVFVSKDPIRVTVAEPDDLLMARGRVLRGLALERLTNPAAPAYEGASGYLTLTAPGWARLDETEQIA